jgi:glucosamine-6-phosphate deaminase
MLVIVKDDDRGMSLEAAEIVADRIGKNPDLVLGLATGSTPLGLYRELVRMHRESGLDFSRITTFNLDEYLGLSPTHEQSYHYFMRKNFFDHLNIPRHAIHIPDGTTRDPEATCARYEEEIANAGGIDLQILGIGSNGHIAFNEPGSSLGSRTRVKTLTEKTCRDNARFFAAGEKIPAYALTMGVGTIMDARELLLLANGDGKADAIRSAVEGPVTAQCPASIVQMHRKAIILIDRTAGAKLTGSYPDSWRSSIVTTKIAVA